LENKLWPKNHTFAIFLSHDIDTIHQMPFQGLYYFLTQKKFKYLRSLFEKRDPYWRFEEMMALEEKYQVRSTFFFLQEKTSLNLFKPITWRLSNDRYEFSNPKVIELFKKLENGGWEVGLHGSYYSYNNEKLLAEEKDSLEKSLGHAVAGIRQHHLNLNEPETWKIQAKIGLQYDSTYGLKKEIGWREGKYLPYRPLNNNFLEIPLVIMDINVFKGDLSGQNLEKLWQKCLAIFDEAEKNGAMLSVLWHNRFFNDQQFPGFTALYEKIIKEGKRRNAWFATGGQIYKQLNSQKKDS